MSENNDNKPFICNNSERNVQKELNSVSPEDLFMPENNDEKSFVYNNSGKIVQRRLNPVLSKIFRFIFRNMNFEAESLKILNEYMEKGHVVFASFNSSSFSLAILHVLLSRHGIEPPAHAFDYRLFLSQRIILVLIRIRDRLLRIIFRKRIPKYTDAECMSYLFQNDKSIILSLVSSKFFLRRYMEVKHDSIKNLIDVKKRDDKPVYLLPVIIYWNKSPEGKGGIISSRAAGNRGFLSALFVRMTSLSTSVVRILKPVDLGEEIQNAQTQEPEQTAIQIRNSLLEDFHSEKRSVLGPVMKSRHEMMERVLYHKDVLEQIDSVARERKWSDKKARKKAYRYFKEISSDFSIDVIHLFKRGLDILFPKMFDGFSVDPEFYNTVREAMQKGGVILAPSHKSHIDYMLISYLLYANNIVPPHIAAGANLAFFPVAWLLRHSGAFFMRRTFKGKALYSAVFRQYLKTLIFEGYLIEFFIEGGRTRTGKLVYPRLGFLSFLVNAVKEGYNRDLTIIPISVNYDRILEEKAYKHEVMGSKKREESASNLFKTRKLIKKKYGKIYLEFNKPVSMKELMGEESPDQLVSIGRSIISRINQVTTVTPYAITTLGILLHSVRGFSRESVNERVHHIYDFLVHFDIRLSDLLKTKDLLEPVVNQVLESYARDRIIESPEVDEDGSEQDKLYVLREENRGRIGFYKNSIIHYFVPLSYCSLAVLSCCKNGMSVARECIVDEFRKIQDVFSREFIISDHQEMISWSEVDKIYAYLVQGKFINEQDGKVSIADDAMHPLLIFSSIIRDYLESYRVVCSTLASTRSAPIDKKKLISDIRKRGVKMFHLGEVVCAESLSMPNYANAVDALVDKGFLERSESGKVSELRVVKYEEIDSITKKTGEYLKVLDESAK